MPCTVLALWGCWHPPLTAAHPWCGGCWQKELAGILKDYVGRESPLYFAERLTEHYARPDGGPHIYLKREDLNHTGAHKINNAIGQVGGRAIVLVLARASSLQSPGLWGTWRGVESSSWHASQSFLPSMCLLFPEPSLT